MPSFFCDSDIDKFLNYNNITHKLRDTHQARDFHPYHYYYYYYYYTVFWCCKGDDSNKVKKERDNRNLLPLRVCRKTERVAAIIIVITIILYYSSLYVQKNLLQSIQSKLPKLSWHSGDSRGSVMECVHVFVCVCVCLHVLCCSYWQSSVQWVKQFSESFRDIPVVTRRRGGSEVMLHHSHLVAQVETLQSETRNLKATPWSQHQDDAIQGGWNIAGEPTCAKGRGLLVHIPQILSSAPDKVYSYDLEHWSSHNIKSKIPASTSSFHVFWSWRVMVMSDLTVFTLWWRNVSREDAKEGERSLCTDFWSQSDEGARRRVGIKACVYRSIQGLHVVDL